MSGDAAEARNEFSGTAHAAVQARDIHGSVTVRSEGPAPPWQVPAHLGPFVNRTSDLDRLRSRLVGTTTSITVVDGARGIGKTALLRVAAAQFGNHFPGGVFHVHFAGDATRPQAQSDYWVTFLLQSLGVDNSSIQASVEARAAQYASVTRGLAGPMLLVVEGATQPAQIRPLVPAAPGSALLVTADGPSLGELELDAAVAHTLDPLAPDAAAELLRELCEDPLEETACTQLVRACAGLPLALVMAASRVRRGTAADTVARQLDTQRSQLAEVGVSDRLTLETVFTDSYAQLSPTAATHYRALSRWPGNHCGTDLVTALTDGEEHTTRAALTELRAANLVEADPARQVRFRHELIRTHARERDRAQTPDSDRRAGLRRALDHYLALLGHAERTLNPTRLRCIDLRRVCAGTADPFAGDGAQARTFLEAERETLPGVVHTAAEAGLDEHAWQCAELATALYLRSRYLHDWMDTGLAGAAAARRVGNVAAEARLRSLTSRPLLDLGRWEQAEIEVNTAVQLAESSEVSTRADAYLLRASIAEFHGRFLESGDPEAARTAYDRARELNARAAEAHDPIHAANGRRGLALVDYFRARSLLACEHATNDNATGGRDTIGELRAALDRFQTLDPPDDRMAARVRASLGTAHSRRGELAEASRELDTAIRALQAEQLHAYEAEARLELAHVLGQLGLSPREHLEAARTLFHHLGSPRAQEAQRRLDKLAG
ncbi:hypothetical protein RIF23_11285 [Lipingzhangella sp. LS1_29]|uniref:Tetratricopeptide repeat protein n=1 Tax=Lipingzhangella rawalii TaxID=2055835 RepID=A0ABU2H7Q2_9ACTN|nr:hypothetical protein [Lipingzhangella rawalii]MDS1270885.1 hypothetical protein [Lipingzhangella rawalii]